MWLDTWTLGPQLLIQCSLGLFCKGAVLCRCQYLRSASGCVVECQICNCRFESQPELLCTKVFSAFHPSGIGKIVPAVAGKAKAGMNHSNCGWTSAFAGKTVKSLENTCYTWALLWWWFDESLQRGTISSVYTFAFTLHWTVKVMVVPYLYEHRRSKASRGPGKSARRWSVKPLMGCRYFLPGPRLPPKPASITAHWLVPVSVLGVSTLISTEMHIRWSC